VGCDRVKVTFDQLALEAAVVDKSPKLRVDVVKVIGKMLRGSSDMYTYVVAIRFEPNLAVRDNYTARRVSITSKDKLVDQSG